MRSLAELRDVDDPAWPALADAIQLTSFLDELAARAPDGPFRIRFER